MRCQSAHQPPTALVVRCGNRQRAAGTRRVRQPEHLQITPISRPNPSFGTPHPRDIERGAQASHALRSAGEYSPNRSRIRGCRRLSASHASRAAVTKASLSVVHSRRSSTGMSLPANESRTAARSPTKVPGARSSSASTPTPNSRPSGSNDQALCGKGVRPGQRLRPGGCALTPSR